MSAAASSGADPNRRAYWLKTLHRWHWISAAPTVMGTHSSMARGG